MSTDDNIPFLSKRFLTFEHDTSVSAATATASILESNNKYRIWLLIPIPKIDFLLEDSLAQQHSFTSMFINNFFTNLKIDALYNTIDVSLIKVRINELV